MVHILVIGGSRGIGGAVCLAAASRGHSVRALSRSGLTPPVSGRDVIGIKGDALNAVVVARPLEEIDFVVQALGVPPSLDLITKPVRT